MGTPEQERIDLFRGKSPRATQEKFLASNARHKAYIGNFGSGKTEALVWQDILLAHLFAPNFTLIGRYRYPDLRDTTRKRYIEIADPKLILRASIPERGDGFVDWKCGSTTIFRNLDEPSKFGSLELGAAGIDEAYECPEAVWNFLTGRVGRHFTGARRGKCYAPLYAATNPGGRDYLYKLFGTAKAVAETQRARREGLVPDYELFHPHWRENEDALPPDYYKNLQRGKPDWWVRRFVRGELGALEGLVWPSFDESIHVIAPMQIPKHWPRRQGVDHGQRNPTAALWSAVDEDGNLVIYREYEAAGKVPREHVAAWSRLEKAEPKPDRRMADPSMFNKTIPGDTADKWHSIADEYELCAFYLDRADNAMMSSLTRVADLLYVDQDHAYPHWHPKAGKKGAPRIYFARTCERTIDRVGSWKFKEYATDSLGLREDPEDKDDHHIDALRYIATSFPEPAKAARPTSARQATIGEWQVARLKTIARHHRKLAAQGGEMNYDDN